MNILSAHLLTNPKSFLSKPVDISVLVLYRILFGFCMLLHAYLYNAPENIIIDFVMPQFFFSFSFFQWLHLPILNPTGFHLLFTLMGLAAFCVMVGLFYRCSVVVLLITQIYIALIEKSYFPDPNYLYILITFLMLFIDAHSQFSIETIFNPCKKKTTYPIYISGASDYNSSSFIFTRAFQNFFILIGFMPDKWPLGWRH